MNLRKTLVLVSALAGVIGVAPLAAAEGVLSNAPGPLPLATMQSLSSEAAAWHTGDGSVYDSSRGRATPGAVPEGTPAQPSRGSAVEPTVRRPMPSSQQQRDYSAPPTPRQ